MIETEVNPRGTNGGSFLTTGGLGGEETETGSFLTTGGLGGEETETGSFLTTGGLGGEETETEASSRLYIQVSLRQAQVAIPQGWRYEYGA